MLTAARKRESQSGVFLTAEEQAIIQRIQEGHGWTNEPIAMVPVAQLYAHDIPDLHPPLGCDLLQVFWCPFDHFDEYMPKAKLVWRSSSKVTALLSEPPQPVVVQSEYYVPEPCVVHPEQVIEYPEPLVLDEDLRERLEEWGGRTKVWVDKVWDGHELVERENPELERAYYQYELSVAPGWKVGGWAPLSFRDVWPVVCTTCGAEMGPLLTISSGEWDDGSHSWIPIEDQALADNPANLSPPPWDPVRVTIGRGYNMQIYTCPVSVDHPHAEWMQ
jgi:hypothetical protein